MAKRKVTQDDLRKLMAQAKNAKGPQANTAPSKRYKLSSRELALLEDQKREDERKKAKERERKAAALANLPSLDAVPQKSILKNKSTPVPQIYRPPPSSLPSREILAPSSTLEIEPQKLELPTTEAFLSSEKAAESKDSLTKDVDIKVDESSTTLPEGFFDDPIQDAKARNVQYVDTAEEEWSRFQKEIGDEMNVAQDILVEDRNEATIDRQIEEIDEQMRAWSRVAEMEKKKDETVHNKCKQTEKFSESKSNQDSDDEEEFEEFFDWRNKK